ncbi:MAG TPA: TIGR00730 family Rossman fold protein [Solimonas sp.]
MRLCVFCGSSDGARPAYRDAAHALGKALADAGIGLVYGGAAVGLMGAVADGALARGGEVMGVLPRSLADRELAHPGLTQLHVVGSMHERKAMMAKLSDGFIALPGGLGTFEELFEIWTWAQLGYHRKPVALLNVDGYYDGLLSFLDHTVREAFVKTMYRDALIVERGIPAMLDAIARYQPPATTKWIDHDQT